MQGVGDNFWDVCKAFQRRDCRDSKLNLSKACRGDCEVKSTMRRFASHEVLWSNCCYNDI